MAINETNVKELRSEFPSLNTVEPGGSPIFFCGPGGSQAHGSVLKAMNDYLTSANSNAHGHFLYSRRTDEIVDAGRQAVADFLNAPRPEEIVFGPNMTTLTFRISQAIGRTLEAGDEVVITRLDHDGNVAPWLSLEALGIKVRFVDINVPECTLNMEEMKKTIGPRTKLVAVGYASNAVGTVNDVRTIVDWAHEAGALIYIDAVHYAPHGPIDVQALECDFLACSPYKFFGPHHGAVYGRFELLDRLPAHKARPASDDPPDKFETGTNNFEAINGTAATVDYLASIGRRFGREFMADFPDFSGRRLELKAGMAAVRAYEKQLCRRLIDGLQEIEGLTIYGLTDPGDADRRVPTVSFTSDRLSPSEIASKLDERKIFVWDGHFYAWETIKRLGLDRQGGVVRIGITHYNTPDEVETLIKAIEEVQIG